MGQKLVQTQTEKQIQILSPQQVIMARTLEMSLTELEQKVESEVIDNIALEVRENGKEDRDDGFDRDEDYDSTDTDDTANDRTDAGVLFDENDDTDGHYGRRYDGTDYNIPAGDTKSFADELYDQIGEYFMTERQKELVEYLIGCLNKDGFLDSPLQKISDDLLLYMNMDVSVAELEDALKLLQNFEPAGIGAKDLKESLIIQLKKIEAVDGSEKGKTKALAISIIERFYNDLLLGQFRLIAKKLKVSETEVSKAVGMISKMNPAPGRALNESAKDRVQTATPDVIIDVDNEGEISFFVNDGNIPTLGIDPEYIEQMKNLQRKSERMSSNDREAYSYLKKQIDGANIFISAIQQRRHTLAVCTKAITELQRDFIISQDDNDLKPMILNDVAVRAGVDISTVSRVKKSKFVLLNGSLYSFKHFFIRTRTNATGEVVIGNDVNEKIKSIIEQEDKNHPFDDENIVTLLEKQGMNISRRTVAKYRKNLGYPIASKRKLR